MKRLEAGMKEVGIQSLRDHNQFVLMILKEDVEKLLFSIFSYGIPYSILYIIRKISLIVSI